MNINLMFTLKTEKQKRKTSGKAFEKSKRIKEKQMKRMRQLLIRNKSNEVITN